MIEYLKGDDAPFTVGPAILALFVMIVFAWLGYMQWRDSDSAQRDLERDLQEEDDDL